MIIRLARAEERQELEELQRRASLALEQYREQLEANPDAIDLPLAQVEQGDVLIAEHNGEIVGFAAIDGSELDGLFVEPERWREGIGRALAEAAIHEARCRGLSLTVTAEPSAQAFYEKCGFRVEGEAETRFGPALRMSR